MKLRGKLCVLMLAAILIQLLAACQATSPAESSSMPDVSNGPVQSQKASDSEEPAVSKEPLPEPDEEPGRWDPEHRLDVSFTPAQGLELPVSGATGYASVTLPLWGELPRGSEGKLTTIYAPSEPSAEPAPEPTPEPVPEPAPSDAGPVQEPPVDSAPAAEGVSSMEEPPTEAGPAAGEPGSPTDASETEMGETVPPAESESDEADPLITVEPIEEITPESTFEPTPEPVPEPAPKPNPMKGALAVLEPGTAFTILLESGDWWQVRLKGGKTGWVEHRYCLINLPDVVPSIVYNATNAYSSIFVSSGKRIPSITGEALYHGKENNPRLGYPEFMMPVLYSMAKNVCKAQQNALAEGNTIVLYEGYRPAATQTAVVRGLSALAQHDSEVKAGISTSPWNISWFIATGVSNHQRGYAMDVSLAKVTHAHMETISGYSVIQVEQYEEYTMPTPIHELSMAAATFTQPVAPHSDTAWRTAELTPAMSVNPPALALQRYCTEARLTPLASEWWHFNDLGAYIQAKDYLSSGNYEIRDCLSTAP